MKFGKTGVACFLAAVFATVAHADNINGIEFVDILSGGGDSDLDANRNGYGAVNYNYKISQYEISYSQFSQSGITTVSGNIDRWVGEVGSPAYAPVVNITYHEAARYANWLTSGNENIGAYTIVGGEVTGIMTREDILADGGLFFVLPTENEWYRAAYNISGTANYSLYANGTSTTPTQGLEANYGLTSSGPAWGITNGAVEVNNGTYNMMGNVWEWMETAQDGNSISNGVVFRGGSFRNPASRLDATYRNTSTLPGDIFDSGGMRIVAIPEPGTISLMGLSTVGLFATRTIRRRKYLGKSLLPVRRQRLCDEFASAAERAHYEQVQDVESVDLLAVVVAGCAETMGKVRSGYRNMDKAFWNHMVARYERRLVKRQAMRVAIKEKSLAALDAFLARIMK